MPEVTIERIGPEELARTFNVRFYEEAYNRGITVSQLLEQWNPTSERTAEERADGSDAFERVLQQAGIITVSDPKSGRHAVTWGEATANKEKRAMMHEWAARIYRGATSPENRALLLSGDAGLNTLANAYQDDLTIRAKRLVPTIPLDRVIARTTSISGDAYRSVYITDDLNTDAYRLKRVNEGAAIPETTLVTGEHVLRLAKYGRALRSTYEQMRRMRIDRVSFLLQRMALQAEVDKVVDAMNTIINGDGNANTSATVLALTALDTAAVAGTLTLKGWLTFKARFTNAYTADTVLAQEAAMMQLLLLPVNTVNGTPLIMLPGGAFGSVTPINDLFGNAIAYGITADAPALKLVAFDSSMTVEMINEIGGEVSEIERFIQDQTQLFTLTEVVGFGIIDTYASRILNINA